MASMSRAQQVVLDKPIKAIGVYDVKVALLQGFGHDQLNVARSLKLLK